jgi:hypothetical protein
LQSEKASRSTTTTTTTTISFSLLDRLASSLYQRAPVPYALRFQHQTTSTKSTEESNTLHPIVVVVVSLLLYQSLLAKP